MDQQPSRCVIKTILSDWSGCSRCSRQEEACVPTPDGWWAMSKTTLTHLLCKRLWVTAGLVSCFHVPSAYSGHCSKKTAATLDPSHLLSQHMPTSGASTSPREGKEPNSSRVIHFGCATVFLGELQRGYTHSGAITCSGGWLSGWEGGEGRGGRLGRGEGGGGTESLCSSCVWAAAEKVSHSS